jgi:hypothetical protein
LSCGAPFGVYLDKLCVLYQRRIDPLRRIS